MTKRVLTPSDRNRPPGRRSLAFRWGLVVVALAVAGGCVQRRLTVRSNPPGALVFIDKYEIGITPVSTDYIYYGTREIRLVKDGCETLVVRKFIPPPWYELFPLDFVAENLVPVELRDQRTLDFQLTPRVEIPTEQLLGRADELRRGSHIEGYLPPPQIKPTTGIVMPPWLPSFSAPPPAPPVTVQPLPPPVNVQPLPAPAASGS